MSTDNQPDAQPGKEPTAKADPAPQVDPAQKAPSEGTDWKAEARKWENLAKVNKDAARKLEEIENASKSEQERLLERATAAEKRVAELEAAQQVAAWKAEVSREMQVPAEVLAGSTREEIEAHAESLKSLLKPTEPAKGVVGPYVPPAGTGSGSPAGSTAEQFAEALKPIL